MIASRKKTVTEHVWLSKRTCWVIGVVVFLAAVIIEAPASVLTPMISSDGLQFERLEGSLWRGKAIGVRQNAYAIGDVSFSAHLLALIVGRVSYRIDNDGSLGRVDGDLSIRFGPNISMRDLSGQVYLSKIEDVRIMGARLGGIARVDIKELTVGKNGCKAAEGEIFTDVLSAALAVHNLPPIDLIGPITCVDRSLLAELSGESDGLVVNALMTIHPNQRYELTVKSVGASPELRTVLIAAGFEQDGIDVVYNHVGVFNALHNGAS